MEERHQTNEIPIYEAKSGIFGVGVDQETIRLSQGRLSELFQRDQSFIYRHIRNIFREGELDEGTNSQKGHIAQSDKPVTGFSLDVIISFGYPVKSQQGVRFLQWANRVLKAHRSRATFPSYGWPLLGKGASSAVFHPRHQPSRIER